jgi:hypothetical protein
MCHSGNIWGRWKQIKTWYRSNLRGDWILAMLATILSRTSCLLVCYQKNINIWIHNTIILPVVLYGCVTWSLTLRKEHRLRVFEKRVLRWIFWQRRGEVLGGWRKLHNKELLDLYFSQSIIRMIKSWRMYDVWEACRTYKGEEKSV